MEIAKSQYTIEGSSKKPISLDITVGTHGQPLVVFVHGFKGFKDWGTHNLVAAYFASRGLNFLKFNFSHNGITPAADQEFLDLEAFANNTFSKELFDLEEVITFASSGTSFQKPQKLFLLGHSRGGGISIIQAVEDHRITKLVTWASVSRFRSLWMTEQEETWRAAGKIYTENSRTRQQMPLNVDLLLDLEHNSEQLDILTAARSIEQEWLIVHGEADSSVPIEQAYELHRQQAKSKLLAVPGTDHVFGAKHPWDKTELPPALKEVCDSTIAFLKE